MTRPPLDADPPAEALAWVAEATGRAVAGWVPLSGATTAAVHAMRLVDGAQVVLKHYVWTDFLDGHPQAAEQEAWALTAVEGHVPAPRLLAVDPDGRAAGAPAVLTTLLRGRPDPALEPIQLAGVAAALRAVDPGGCPWSYRPYFEDHPLFAPAWAQAPTAWEMLIAIARRLDRSATGFIHRDFHPWNVVAEEGSVTGLVDWLSAGAGPWQIDVSHCRLNLVLAGSNAAADAFTEAYERLAGRRYRAEWDALSILDVLPFHDGEGAVDAWGGYSILAVTMADRAEQRVRLDAFARRTVGSLA